MLHCFEIHSALELSRKTILCCRLARLLIGQYVEGGESNDQQKTRMNIIMTFAMAEDTILLRTAAISTNPPLMKAACNGRLTGVKSLSRKILFLICRILLKICKSDQMQSTQGGDGTGNHTRCRNSGCSQRCCVCAGRLRYQRLVRTWNIRCDCSDLTCCLP